MEKQIMKRLITEQQERAYRLCHHDFDGHTIQEAAEIMRITPVSVYKLLARMKKAAPHLFPILSKNHATIWRMFLAGKTCKQIADELGETEAALQTKLYKVKEKMGYTEEFNPKAKDVICFRDYMSHQVKIKF
jgi:DNA-binding CsgD family transcriptional regulator